MTHAPATHAGDKVSGTKNPAGRLEFLDAIRGIAALTVALLHTSEQLWTGVIGWSHYWFRPGEWGVLAFFLCSGFIIPASIERRGSIKEFWIGRFFRLWPLYLFVLFTAVIAIVARGHTLPASTVSGPVLVALNTTMMQVFTPWSPIVGASWTLGYEMVFYLLVTGLFVAGAHKRSGPVAITLFGLALLVGASIPSLLLTRLETPRNLVLLVAIVGLSVGWLLFSTSLARRQKLIAAAFIAPTVLLAANRPHDSYFPLLLFGTMFTGTVAYRYTKGEVKGGTLAFTYITSMIAVLAVLRVHHIGYTEPTTGVTPQWWTEAGTFLGAYAIFGIALLFRRKQFPRVLTYLGEISYSVYLLHALVLLAVPRLENPIATMIMWNTLTIGGSVLTYRYIEKPAIDLGRKVTRRLRERQAPPSPETTPATS